jgi:hypothetical protein
MQNQTDMIKDFTEWHQVKTQVQHRNPPYFREREIWWCYMGMNIRHEADGKGGEMRRPVLVLRKFNADCFIGIPLTTVIKDNPYYFRFHFQGRMQCAMISQLKMMDASRLINSMGRMKSYPFNALKDKVKEML